METKTYFASSVQAAMDVARRELGPDAMLVTSRPAPEDVQAFGRLEVTFAWDAAAARSAAKTASGNAASGHVGRRSADTTLRPVEPIVRPGSAERSSGLEDIRLEISALRAAIGLPFTGGKESAGSQTRPAAAPEMNAGAVHALCEVGFEEDTARQIAAAAARDAGQTGDAILRELTSRIPAGDFSPLQPQESRTLAFAGPAGRGKTTSLIKVALRYGLAKRIPTRIYTAGAHGVGAAEQMARYAAILGVPFQAVESFESLHLALQGDRWRGLVLIDTPGQVAGDRHEMQAMTKFFSLRSEIERHLVLRAEARSADMQYMLSLYAAIQPSRLLFTGVDEVRGLGAAADTMIRSRIPAAFFGTGARIPEDLEEVSVAKLARSLWAGKGLAAKAA
jgi:flagellar biosynthesis protein FlhF